MKIPKEFKRFGEAFFQDIDIAFESEAEVLDFALRRLSVQEFVVVRTFIQKLLAGPYTPDQLDDIWQETGTDIYIHDKKIPLFFEQILIEMEKRL